jgi:peptidoglycan/xylan/chitin deacetylase (PgdA/CDA1 family)
MSIRKDFISYTSPISAALPLDLLCKLSGHNFILPFYHIVSDEGCPHIKNLYRYKNIRQFESDIDYLACHYTPIGAEALPDVLADKYKGKKIMLLTFDDGLRQMYDIVAPILLRKGIPAIFFLNTDFIDNKALMFRYKASIIKSMGMGTDKMFDATSDNDLKNTVGLSITDKVENTLQTFLTDYQPYMTSDHIKSLISQGFTIGAHSCSHPYYEGLTQEKQLAETFDSIDILKTEFGTRQNLFAFPFTDHGVSKAFFDSIFDSDKVDFSFGGAGIKNDIHPRQFQRIPMEGWNASAEQILKSEYLYYLLRAPLGKNTIVRK